MHLLLSFMLLAKTEMKQNNKLIKLYIALVLALSPVFPFAPVASAEPGNFFLTFDAPSVAPGQQDVPVYVHLNSNGTDVSFAGCEIEIDTSLVNFSHGADNHGAFTSDFAGPNGNFNGGSAPTQQLFYANDTTGVAASAAIETYVMFYDVEASASGTINFTFDTADTSNCLINDTADPNAPFVTITGATNTLDVSGVTVTESAGSTDVVEAGATDTFDVVLDAEPTSDVIINVTDDAQTNTDVASVTFTNANWDTPQTVTVSAEDDATVEGAHTGTVSMSVDAASDALYTGLTVPSVTVNVADDDGLLVEFTNASSNDNEDAGGNLPQLVVSGSDTSGGATRSIDVSVTGGDATGGGDDYSFTGPETITIPAGNYITPQTFSLSTLAVVSDGVTESDETIVFGLSNESAGLAVGNANGDGSTDATHTYTINNDDGLLIELSSTTANDVEDTGANMPTVTVFGGVAVGTETIDVAVSGGTATSGTDYTLSPTTITVPAGDYSVTPANLNLGLAITADSIVESDETVQVSVSNPVGASIGDADGVDGIEDSTTYTILNDDTLSIELSQAASSGSEALPLPVVQVLVNGASEVATQFVLTDDGTGTATDGSDYGLTTGAVTIPAASYDGTLGTALTLPLSIVNDYLIEADETVDLTVSAPSVDVVLADIDTVGGIVNSHSYTIIDEDQLVVEFDTAAASAVEDAGYTPRIKVGGAIAQSAVSVDVVVTGGDATDAGSDYTFAGPVTVTIPLGNYSTPQLLDVAGFAITPDTNEESDETVDFAVQNPTGGAVLGDADGTNGIESMLTLTILDDDSVDVDGDTDNDGVADTVEDAGPNGGDANGDGTQDSVQAEVSAIVNGLTGEYTVLELTSGCTTIDDFDVVTETAQTFKDGNYDYPYGLKDFTLSCASAGDSGTVTILLDKAYDTTGWVMRKLNRNSGAYSDVASAVLGSKSVGGNNVTTITYDVTDGGSLDEDGTVNAVITDPIGIGTVAADATDNTGEELSDTGQSAAVGLASGMAVLLLAVGASKLRHQRAYYTVRRK